MKIALGAFAVCIASFVAVIVFTVSSIETDFRREFQSSRAEITNQIASNIADGLLFKKAGIVEDAYRTLIQDPAKPIAALASVTADGEVVTQFSEDGKYITRLIDLPKASSGSKPGKARTVWLGDELITIAPSGSIREGKPTGYVVIAWNTGIIAGSLANVQYNLLQALLIATLAIVGAVFFLVSRLITIPLKRVVERMTPLSQGDTVRPIPHEDRVDEIGSISRALAAFRHRDAERLALEKNKRPCMPPQPSVRSALKVLSMFFERKFKRCCAMPLRSLEPCRIRPMS